MVSFYMLISNQSNGFSSFDLEEHDKKYPSPLASEPPLARKPHLVRTQSCESFYSAQSSASSDDLSFFSCASKNSDQSFLSEINQPEIKSQDGSKKKSHSFMMNTCMNFFQENIKSWKQTVIDIQAVRKLRKKMQFSGYPFHRLQVNQFGDGLLNAGVSALLITTAGMNPLAAGLLGWGIRISEFMMATVWNQKMASDRRLARIAATNDIYIPSNYAPKEEAIKETAGQSKAKAAREIISSAKYDAVAGVATISAAVILMTGGPVGAVIALGVVIAFSQTLSKFKEVAWHALRFVVNPSPEVRQQQVDLQEPMAAYEMFLNIAVMTVSYAAGFSTLALLYVLAPHVLLPLNITLVSVGILLMVHSKLKFKKEEQQGLLEHQTMPSPYSSGQRKVAVTSSL